MSDITVHMAAVMKTLQELTWQQIEDEQYLSDRQEQLLTVWLKMHDLQSALRLMRK